MNNKPDVKYILEDTNGNKFKIIDTQKVDLQEELNKDIVKQAKEIERQKEIIRQLDIKNLELTTIIKEVREYIEEKVGNEIHDMMYVIDVSDILEILDKVDKEKEQ